MGYIIVEDTNRRRVTGNDQASIDAVEALLAELENHGATIDSNCEVVVMDGDVTVCFNHDSDESGIVMDIPLSCCPVAGDYNYSLNDDCKLTATLIDDPVHPGAKPVMDKLVSYFNQTNKFLTWKQTFPIFALLKLPGVLNKILGARKRSDFDFLLRLCSAYKNGSKDEAGLAIILSFFDSRVMSIDAEQYRKIGVKTKHDCVRGFVPGGELMNHSMTANPYRYNVSANSMQVVVPSGKYNREVFVSYNKAYDPLSMFIQYGFVDRSAIWVYANPCTLNLSNGKTIVITEDKKSANKDELPKELQSIGDYIPGSITIDEDLVEVSMLRIPDRKNVEVLREALTYVVMRIAETDPSLTSSSIPLEVEYLEAQIISETLRYWHELKEEIELIIDLATNEEEKVLRLLMELSDYYVEFIGNYAASPKSIIAA